MGGGVSYKMTKDFFLPGQRPIVDTRHFCVPMPISIVSSSSSVGGELYLFWDW